jgi:hypothetical protein
VRSLPSVTSVAYNLIVYRLAPELSNFAVELIGRNGFNQWVGFAALRR